MFHIGITEKSFKQNIDFISVRNSEDTILLILKEILQLDGFEPHTRFETIEQMIKSNLFNK